MVKVFQHYYLPTKYLQRNTYIFISFFYEEKLLRLAHRQIPSKDVQIDHYIDLNRSIPHTNLGNEISNSRLIKLLKDYLYISPMEILME
jgi:gamma-glutamylcysteine synthetase